MLLLGWHHECCCLRTQAEAARGSYIGFVTLYIAWTKSFQTQFELCRNAAVRCWCMFKPQTEKYMEFMLFSGLESSWILKITVYNRCINSFEAQVWGI